MGGVSNACTKTESEFDKRAKAPEAPQSRKIKTFYWDYYGKRQPIESKEWLDMTFAPSYRSITKRIDIDKPEEV